MEDQIDVLISYCRYCRPSKSSTTLTAAGDINIQHIKCLTGPVSGHLGVSSGVWRLASGVPATRIQGLLGGGLDGTDAFVPSGPVLR